MSGFPYQELKSPYRILLGPGPSNIHPRVQKAMMEPLVGHLDPYISTIMDDTANLLRFVFQTKNELAFPISGTGFSGMDAAFGNFIEPGDVAVIGVNGIFGEKMTDIAQRYGAEVIRVEAEWGKMVEPEAVAAVLKTQKKVKLVALVHVETSTGVLQPLEEISRLAKEHEALFLVDTVASLGGQEVAVDDWGIDIGYSGSQKCLSAPPGLAPFTANRTALDTLTKRAKKVPSFYLDLSLIAKYWTAGTKAYHHTGPVLQFYALHEALALIAEEGLEARVTRHLRNGTALRAGLEAMGLKLFAQEECRSNSLTSVCIPVGVDDLRIRQRLLNDFSIEIGVGLGALKGKIWRIGLMGHSSSLENVLLILAVLEKLLADEGYKTEPGAGLTAASQILKQSTTE